MYVCPQQPHNGINDYIYMFDSKSTHNRGNLVAGL